MEIFDEVLKNTIKLKILLKNYIKDFSDKLKPDDTTKLNELLNNFENILEKFENTDFDALDKKQKRQLINELLDLVSRLHDFFYNHHPEPKEIIQIKEKANLQVEASFFKDKILKILKNTLL